MSRRPGWSYAALLLALLVAAAAWRLWLVPLQMMHELGLRGPLFTTGRECWHSPSTSTVRCDALRQLSLRPPSHEQEVVIYDAKANSLHYLEHSWVLSDSMTWVRLQDSIRGQMRARRVPSRSCAALDSLRALTRRLAEQGVAPMTKTTIVWRFPHQDVRVDAYDWLQSHSYQLNVVGFADGTPECRQPTVVYHLLTWDEMMTEWRHWAADQLGL